MEQNTMFPNLIQKFISDEDTAQERTVKTLIQYLVIAAVCEWKSCFTGPVSHHQLVLSLLTLFHSI
ncbi:hypothetical protein [Bacillus xiapuensis]|uniref:hypothetical protein n=1 Tax=Bacillus xiapuensis TaxID=2014075 RepID=UPI000C2343E9|nr:hypothetical protein [Bacillus xiapuensis]